MESDHVREHSPDDANQRIDDETVVAVGRYADAPGEAVAERLRVLDQEWDIERRLEANAAVISLTAVTLTALTGKKRWLVLAGLVPGFLLQHAVQGWCPPIEVFRRTGARTRKEIDTERTALKHCEGTSPACPDPVGVWPSPAAVRAARSR